MIGLITGFGTRAGHLVYTKFLNSFVADHDCDWPEIMVVNVAPKFDKYATVTPDIISKLRSTASMMQDCSQVFVACNTVHLYKNEWFCKNSIDWTEEFKKTIPNDFVRIGSKTSANEGLYDMADDELVSDLIECYIGSASPERSMRAHNIWKALQKHKKIALCCTELSLAYAEFGCNPDVTVLDCSDFLVKMMITATNATEEQT